MKSKVEINFSILITLLLLGFISCNTPTNSQTDTTQIDTVMADTTPILDTIVVQEIKPLSRFELMLDSLRLVPLSEIDSSIVVDLRYSSTNNFLEKDLYGDFNTCYLEENTAKKLSKAQLLLKNIDPGLSIVVFDAVRPRSIQTDMWNHVDMKIEDKKKFLANPDLISLHNFGAAVDVAIILKDGSYLDMGTTFDFQGELAYPSLEDYFIKKGILGINQVENRKILRECMTKSGFIYNKYEWWHFSSYKRAYAIMHYPIIESFSTYSNPSNSNIVTKDQDQKVVFKVQILTSNYKLKSKNTLLKGIKAEEYKHQGSYKYTTGRYYDLESTYKLRDSIRSCCFKNAFVVCFHNGERIHIQKAIELLQ